MQWMSLQVANIQLMAVKRAMREWSRTLKNTATSHHCSLCWSEAGWRLLAAQNPAWPPRQLTHTNFHTTCKNTVPHQCWVMHMRGRMNYTGLFERICAISEEELYKAPLPDGRESVCLSSAQFTQGQVPRRRALTGSLVKDTENKVTVSSASLKNFSKGPNPTSYVKLG